MTTLSHIYCCQPHLALCTTNIANEPDSWDDQPLCIVCDDLTQAGEPCSAGCRFADLNLDSWEQRP